MKLKFLLALVALAGLASALALASPTQAGDGKHGSDDRSVDRNVHRHLGREEGRQAPGGIADHDHDDHLEHGERAAPAPQLAPLIDATRSARGAAPQGAPRVFRRRAL